MYNGNKYYKRRFVQQQSVRFKRRTNGTDLILQNKLHMLMQNYKYIYIFFFEKVLSLKEKRNI